MWLFLVKETDSKSRKPEDLGEGKLPSRKMNECPLKRDPFFPKEMNHRPVPSFFPENTPPKFNSSPLKNGGWKTTSLLGFGNFSGASC